MPAQDTRVYRERLSIIPQEKRGKLRHKLVPWIYTNDEGFGNQMPFLIDSVRAQKKTGNMRAAVLSGVGSLFNIAPYADVDFFVSVDRNSFVLDCVQEMVHMVKEASTPEECIRSSFLTSFFDRMREEGIETKDYYNIERASFGDWHFLASQENFDRTRNTLLKTPVMTSQGNFTSPEYVSELGNALQGLDVSYASFTDLGEWYKEFLDLVPALPFSKDSTIVWATNRSGDGNPSVQLSTGIDDYLSTSRKINETLEVDYFKAHV